MNSPVSFLPSCVADIDTVLVAVDCGSRSHSLLLSAAAMARRVGGSLVILHVYEPLTYAPAHCTADRHHAISDHLRSAARERLEDLREELRDDPTIATACLLVAEGSPEHEILAAARQVNAGLVIVSTHGYRGLRHLLLGSKAERLIRRVPCPILILPSGSRRPGNRKAAVKSHVQNAGRSPITPSTPLREELPHAYEIR